MALMNKPRIEPKQGDNPSHGAIPKIGFRANPPRK